MATKTPKQPPNPNIIEYYPNGDPYGGGYQASESTDGGKSFFFRGDASPNSLAFWRAEAKRKGAKLVKRY